MEILGKRILQHNVTEGDRQQNSFKLALIVDFVSRVREPRLIRNSADDLWADLVQR
jgi:hypothetical protein